MAEVSISLMADNFVRDTSNDIVTDVTIGLQWQDDTNISKNWEDAINYCEALTLGGKSDWRLPNINELTSLVDDTRRDPSISNVFKNIISNYYLSSTTDVIYNDNVWIINFGDGDQGYFNKADRSYYVRCVRTIF